MLKLPQSWTNPTPARTRVTAKKFVDGLDMTADSAGKGICPISGNPMVRMLANGHEAWVSLDERIVLPIKD